MPADQNSQPLTAEAIQATATDDELFALLGKELERVFPFCRVGEERTAYLAALRQAPCGLRAMSAIYELDFSMALDDLAWHFTNHYDLDAYQETLAGLRELDALEAAELFEKTYRIIAPHWAALGKELEREDRDLHDWFERAGISEAVRPLNKRMWKLCEELGPLGLLAYWSKYARVHPENCVGGVVPDAK